MDDKQNLSYKGKTEIWNYSGDADITLGEVKESKTPKFILYGILIIAVIAAIIGIIFKDKIHDSIQKSQLILTTNEVTLEVNKDIFDYKDYISFITQLDRYSYSFPDNSQVDTTKLGDYMVTYSLTDSLETKSENLLVHVVDTTPPEIVLTRIADSILRRAEIDLKSYVSMVIDNYDDGLSVNIYPEEIDWELNEVIIEYSSTDSSGNTGKAELHLLIQDEVPETEPHTHEWDEGRVIKEATEQEEGLRIYTCTICSETYPETIAKLEPHEHDYTSKIKTEPTYEKEGIREYTCKICGDKYTEKIPVLVTEPPTTHTHNYSSKITREATYSQTGIKTYTCSCGESYTEEIPMLTTPYVPPTTQYVPPTTKYVPPTTPYVPPTTQPTTPYVPPTTPYVPPTTTKVPQGAYINGTHDITVSVGATPQEIMQLLTQGVYGSGSVMLDISQVNTTVAGTYSATFSSSDGVTITVKVYVK